MDVRKKPAYAGFFQIRPSPLPSRGGGHSSRRPRNNWATEPKAFFTPRQIFGRIQIINKINTINPPMNNQGECNAVHSPPITRRSSLTEATQLEKGSGEALIITREPALVA